jgi:hypothetical protein
MDIPRQSDVAHTGFGGWCFRTRVTRSIPGKRNRVAGSGISRQRTVGFSLINWDSSYPFWKTRNLLKVRELSIVEYELLKSRSAPDGTAYKDILPPVYSPLIESAFVVESETGERIAAALAIRMPEIVLVMEKGYHPTVKELAIAEIHREMRERLHAKGYGTAFAVVPEFLKGYIRLMIRKFGWKRDYPCYRIG